MSGIVSFISELLEETLLPTVAHADDGDVEEASAAGDDTEEKSEEEEEEGGEEEEEEDDDDEDDDEPQDIYPALRDEAADGPCHSFKHHFEECVERVTAAQEEEGYADREYKEDCVEEFFHLNHCIDGVAAPQLFRKLK